MKAVFLCLACVVLLGGCVPAGQFVKGFEGEALRQVAEAVDAKIPEPTDSGDMTLWGGLGALAAYILGSAGKGFIRAKLEERES